MNNFHSKHIQSNFYDIFCGTTAEIRVSIWIDGNEQMDGQTDVIIKMFI